MDVGRFTVKAAVTMGLRLRIVCTVCGNFRIFDATALDRQPPDMRLQALPLLCRTCLHRDVIISVDQPDLLRPADPHALSYHIEEWDDADQKITGIIGAVNNATIAQATFAAAVAEYPRKRIQLRQGCHLMRTHEPPRQVPGSDPSE